MNELKRFELSKAEGTISVKTRNLMKAQVIAKLKTVFPDGEDTEKGFAVPVGRDVFTDTVIFAIVNPVITMSTVVAHKDKEVKAKPDLILPSIFE